MLKYAQKFLDESTLKSSGKGSFDFAQDDKLVRLHFRMTKKASLLG